MRTLAGWLLPLLLSASVANADSWSVTVTISDGTELRGTLDVASFKVEGALGVLDVDANNVEIITVEAGKAQIRTRDGSTIAGVLRSGPWKIVASVGTVEVSADKLKSLRFDGIAPAGRSVENRPPGGATGKPELVYKPPAETGKDIVLPADFKATALEETGSWHRGAVLSRNGSTLFALDVRLRRLVLISTSDMKVTGIIDSGLPDLSSSNSSADASCWCLLPSESKAVVAQGRQVAVLDIASRKCERSFGVEKEILDLAGVAEDACIATTPDSAVLIVPSRQAIVRTWNGSPGTLNMTPDRGRIFGKDGCFVVASNPADSFHIPISGGGRWYFQLDFSGDGRFAIASAGTLYRVGKGTVADLALVAALPAHNVAAFVPESQAFVLFLKDGVVEIRDLGTFEVRKSLQAPCGGLVAVADPAQRFVYAAFAKNSYIGSRYSGCQKASGPGKWFKFEITK